MKDNNPFQPALSQPADDSVLATDNNADDFATDTSQVPSGAAKPPRPTLSLDGISPNFNDDIPLPVDSDVIEQASDDHNTTIDNDTVAPESAAPVLPNTDNDVTTDAIADALNSPDNSADAASPASAIAALADQADQPPTKADKKATKEAAKEFKKSQKVVAAADEFADGEKPPKQFTISIATIVLFALMLIGIAGTIYFWLQNNKNANALANANAKIAQLTDNVDQNTNANNTTSNQYSSLQSKIADQTKTISDQKTQIDTLTKTNTDQAAQITTLTAQANDIKSISDLINGILGNCNIVAGVAPATTVAQTCKATIIPAVAANGSTPATPAKLSITPSQ